MRNHLLTDVPPCRQTLISHTINTFEYEKNSGQHTYQLEFRYAKQEYKDITNIKAFGGESLLSMAGGYVGIFLGYSLLQIPALLEGLLA